MKILYKVYCGKNGKWYTYKSKEKAEILFKNLSLQNYHTILEVVENGKVKRLDEFL